MRSEDVQFFFVYSFVVCFCGSKSLTFVVGCSFRESNGDMLATIQNPISWYPLVSPHFPVDLD